MTELLYGKRAAAAPASTQPAAVDVRAAPGAKPKPIGPEQVVAASALQVNNRFLTVDDILRAIRPKIDELPARISEQTFRHQVGPWIAEETRSQVTRALVLAEADKRLTDEQKKKIDEEVQEAHNEMLADAGGSKTALRQRLAKQGTSLEDVLTRHREDTAFKLYLRARFMPAIVINRRMLWDYYRLNHEKYVVDKKVQMQLIAAPLKAFYAEGVLAPSATEQAAARRKARETIDQAAAALAKGEDFTQLAKRLSRGIKAADGGLWPLMAADTFRETQVEQAAFRLPEGGVSGVIETDSGFYIVKAKRLQAGRVVPFEEAQQEIEETLRNRLYVELTDKYFKDLMAQAHVVGSEEFVGIALGKALEQHFRR
jgi:parvulin-like peptidyl-prolyl isomerase